MGIFKRQPVRVALYSALVPLLGLLVARGVITEDVVPFYLAVAAGVLGVTATEVANKKTVPVAEVEQKEARTEFVEANEPQSVPLLVEDDEETSS